LPADLVASALEPVVAAIVVTVQTVLSDIPAGLAEDGFAARIRALRRRRAACPVFA